MAASSLAHVVDDHGQDGQEQEGHDGQGRDQACLPRGVGAAKELELLAPAAFVAFVTPGERGEASVCHSGRAKAAAFGTLAATYTQVSVFMAVIL